MELYKTIFFLTLLSVVFVIVGLIFAGRGGALLALLLVGAMNFYAYYFSHRHILKHYEAKETPSSHLLNQIVFNLSQRANIPMPMVYIIDDNTPNAFATGRDPEHAAVAVTEGILNILPEEELEGVIAHELTHIMNRDTLTQAVAATVAGAISFLAQMLSYTLWFGGSRDNNRGGNPLGVLLTVLLAPITATIIQLAISRTREFSADAGAAKLTGNPRALANALKRLEATSRQMPLSSNPAFEPLLIINPISKKSLRNLFSSHPATDDRVEALLELERQLPRVAY